MEMSQRPIHQAQIAELVLLKARYGQCPFKDGDWVTPRSNGPMALAGEPHVVLEVLKQPRVVWNDRQHPYANTNGVALNMRVAAVANPPGDLIAYWTEACWFEMYVGPPRDRGAGLGH